jgi:hypothetical protein
MMAKGSTGRRKVPAGAEPLRVEVRPARTELDRDLSRLDVLSKMLDSQFSIAGIRFGWDSLIGLVPVAGDLTTAALSLYPIYLAGRHELGAWTIARMLGNVGVDLVVGAVPLLGDVFDVAFKANRRNLEIFRKAVESRRR